MGSRIVPEKPSQGSVNKLLYYIGGIVSKETGAASVGN